MWLLTDGMSDARVFAYEERAVTALCQLGCVLSERLVDQIKPTAHLSARYTKAVGRGANEIARQSRKVQTRDRQAKDQQSDHKSSGQRHATHDNDNSSNRQTQAMKPREMNSGRNRQTEHTCGQGTQRRQGYVTLTQCCTATTTNGRHHSNANSKAANARRDSREATPQRSSAGTPTTSDSNHSPSTAYDGGNIVLYMRGLTMTRRR
jgi:hypothetical protein